MNVTELIRVVEKSNVIFEKLKTKYSKLDGHLVFSSPDGQCEITTNLADALNLFPQMIIDSRQKQKCLNILQKIAEIVAENKKNIGNPKSFEKYKNQLSEMINDLEIKEDKFVEIRFKSTDLDLIYELQKRWIDFSKVYAANKSINKDSPGDFGRVIIIVIAFD